MSYNKRLAEYLGAKYPNAVAGPHTAGGDYWFETFDTHAELVHWDESRLGPKPTPEDVSADLDDVLLQHQRETQEITRLQARLQLLDTPDPTGQFSDAWEVVKAWAEAQGGAVLAFFEDAERWRRLDQFVLQAAPEFGWSAEDLDQLFAAAAQR